MISTNELLDLHCKFNLGVYFTDLEADKSLQFALSSVIPDVIWNFAYRPDGAMLTPNEIEIVRTRSQELDRDIGLWRRLDVLPKSTQDESFSIESWMTADLAGADFGSGLDDPRTAVSILERPTDLERSVFDDAYSSSATEDEIGYFSLPPAYGDAFVAGRPVDVSDYFVVSLSFDGVVASIAACSLDGEAAGLYGVATSHQFRGRGFGKEVSLLAMQEACRRGASRMFLQTGAQSSVERMYASIGFSTCFWGELLTMGA